MERGIHHEVHGAGEPLLLVHGTGNSLRVWDPVLDRLAASRTVIAVDLPGFGTSPPLTPSEPPPTPAGFAVVLADLLRRQSRHRDQLPPQTRWFELSDCGHVPTYDDPALVAEVILEGSTVPDRAAASP